ncbi:MAG: amidohydrolase [Acidobacteriota bacterium]|nr:MAG: amidohydrolase [Acidobacteriota bacterium]
MRFLTIIAVLLFAATSSFAQNADILLLNGKIWTAESADKFVEAAAIRGEKIIAAGSNAAVSKHRSSNTKVIDLKWRFAMPGINDAHAHFLSASMTATQVDLSEAATLEEAQAAIRKFAAENPNAPWITGFGWQYAIFPNARLPLRGDIDAVISDRPVFLSAYDGHTGWANSKALEIAGVTKATEFSGFGEVVRNEKGEPTGVFKESAMGLVRSKIPRPTREQQIEALKRGFKNAQSLGITSIQNAHGGQGETELYADLLKSNELGLRTHIAFSVNPRTTQADIDAIVAAAKNFSSPMLRVGAIKIMVDGVVESYTAAMLEPYTNRPDTMGEPSYTQEQLNNVVQMADKAGLQIYVHAIGDRGVRMALDAFENAIRVNGRRDSRFRIEHIETVQYADIKRFKELGVIASMQPIHADPATINVWSDNIGADRTSRAFAWRAMEQAGVKVIFSSDFPAAISMSPWRGLHSAVNRQTINGFPANGWLKQWSVPVSTALFAYTANGAFASFEEGKKGKIAAGMFADLIVLDRNPFEIAPSDLYRINVETTIIGGNLVFEKSR